MIVLVSRVLAIVSVDPLYWCCIVVCGGEGEFEIAQVIIGILRLSVMSAGSRVWRFPWALEREHKGCKIPTKIAKPSETPA